jgi:hypothetical protein
MYIEEVVIIRHVCIERKGLQLIREKNRYHTMISCAPIRGEQNRIKISDDWWKNIRVFLLLSRLIVIYHFYTTHILFFSSISIRTEQVRRIHISSFFRIY